MPRYYLRLEPGGAADPDGEELASLEVAKEFAEGIAREITRDQDRSFQSLVMIDETGKVVYEAPLVLH